MKLSKSMTLYSALGIGIVCFLPSQANASQASQISAHSSQNKFYQPPSEPKKSKEDYINTMKAILQKDEEILEEIKIKHRR